MTARVCSTCHVWRPCDCDLADRARAADEAALLAADRREDREGRTCPDGWIPSSGDGLRCRVCGYPVWIGQGWATEGEALHRRCPDEMAAGMWRMTPKETA
ncbi:MAG: hypothetical protein ACO3GP_07450 [Candidatus Limnocylindrus sp.]